MENLKNITKYVIYLRLSKEDRNRKQYGFGSQMNDIDNFLSSFHGDGSAEVVGVFKEFVKSSSDHKEEQEKAIKMCKEQGATLLIAKVDRFSRRVSQWALAIESDLSIRVAVMPHATTFELHIYAALSQQEREFIRSRVKAGLAVAKDKGVKLGAASDEYKRNPNNATVKNMQKSKNRAEELRVYIVAAINMSKSGKVGYRAIARVLTGMECELPSGDKGIWQPSQVKRVMNKLGLSLSTTKEE